MSTDTHFTRGLEFVIATYECKICQVVQLYIPHFINARGPSTALDNVSAPPIGILKLVLKLLRVDCGYSLHPIKIVFFIELSFKI